MEELVIEAGLDGDAFGGTDPVAGSFHLAVIGRRSSPGFGIVGAVYFDDVALFVLDRKSVV